MRNILRILVVLGLVVSAMVVPVTTSQAVTWCHTPLCGEVANRLGANQYVKAARKWCGDKSRLYQTNPPCGAGSQTTFVGPGKTTNPKQDWDAFRVENGCTVTWKIWDSFGRDRGWHYPHPIPNTSGKHLWVRLHNDETVYITGRSC